MRTTLLSATLTTVLVLTVAGCSSSGSFTDTHNQADVRYAKDTISTYQHALELAAKAAGRSENPAILGVGILLVTGLWIDMVDEMQSWVTGFKAPL